MGRRIKGREGRKEKAMEGVCGERGEEIIIGEKREEKREEEKRKKMRRGTGTNVTQGAEPDGKGLGTALREVGFLLLQLFYAYGHIMA